MRIALVQLALIQTRRRRSAGQRQPLDVTSVGALLRTLETRSAPSVRGRSRTGCPVINVSGPLSRTYVILVLPKCLLTWGYVKVDAAAFCLQHDGRHGESAGPVEI